MASVTQSPSTAVNVDIGNMDWINVTNVYSQDGNDAYSFEVDMNWLKVTNFGFSIPVGVTIDGIVVSVYGVSNYDDFVGIGAIVKGDTISATEKIITVPRTEGYIPLGGSSDLWGETFTASDINNTNFGFAFRTSPNPQGRPPLSGDRVFVDHIFITIYYTEASIGGQKINIGGEWKEVHKPMINIGDEWKEVFETKINIGGEWKTAYQAGIGKMIIGKTFKIR